MQKQLFFIISLYLITYSFSADTDPCTTKTDSETCKADTTNNCEWTEKKACAAANCTGLLETPCKGIKSCAWDAADGCDDAAACSTLDDSGSPTCANSGYCVWTAATGGAEASCDPVDCTKLDATDAACVGTKGCSLTTTGSCAKKGSNTSGGDGGSNGSDSAFGLKTSLTLLIIGFLL